CQVGADGCTAWGTAVTCPSQTVCEGGECLPLCEEGCRLGDRRCLDQQRWQECLVDESGCPVWGEPLSCVEPEFCDDGFCGTACSNRCELGQQECLDESRYRVCGDYDQDVCLEWSDPSDCPDDLVCTRHGECIPPCPDDGYEPNDLAEQAYLLEGPLLVGLTVCQRDDDWFALEVSSELLLTVGLEYDPDDGEMELDLHDGVTGALLERSDSQEPGFEEIGYAVGTATTLTWRIWLKTGMVSDYEMEVDLLPITADQCLPDARRCTADGQGFQKCVWLEELEVWVWSEVEMCGRGQVCLSEGICEASSGWRWDIGVQGRDASGDVETDLPQGDGGVHSPDPEEGCGCTTGQGAGPVPLWSPMPLLLLAWCERRRRAGSS
ncbi:MAG: hypothetical protein JW797_18895, partial [Bradymonadales bacterium]|nr:hypothetical protein [Bradymonadales bacterium]